MAPTVRLVDPVRSTALERLVDDYLADAGARQLSLKSLAIYRLALQKNLLPWCGAEGITEPAQLTQPVLNRLSVHLQTAPREDGRPGARSRNTVETYLRTISYFVGWAKKQGEVEANVVVQRPRLDRRIIDVLTREEIRRLELATTNERDRLLVRLLADTGVRAGELLGLRREDLVEQGRQRYIRVFGKGRRERLVPVKPELFRELQKYERRRPTRERQHLWWSLTCRPGTGDYRRLRISGLDQMIRELGHKSGVSQRLRVYPHLFRHSFATWQLQRGQNPLVLARILGHANLNMIQNVYSHLVAGDLFDAAMRIFNEEEDA